MRQRSPVLQHISHLNIYGAKLSKYSIEMSNITEEIRLRSQQRDMIKPIFYVIIEVDHAAIKHNATVKDEYKPITKILYVSTDRDQAKLNHKDLLKHYPESKYKTTTHGADVFDVIDIEKKPSWTGAYRNNEHIKTIILDSWRPESPDTNN